MKTFTEMGLRKLIAATQEKFKEASDEEVLNVFPDAQAEEIQDSYNQLIELFHPPYYSFDRYRDVKENLKCIIDRINEAQRNLMERAGVQQPFLKEEADHSVYATPSEAPSKPSAEFKPEAPPADAAAPVPEPAPAADRSVTELQEALSREPVNTALMRELGLKLQQAGRAKDGEKTLLRALEIEPQSLENHFVLAEFYQIQGLKFKAFEHLNVVLQLDPHNQKAMESLGIKKRKGGLYEITN